MLWIIAVQILSVAMTIITPLHAVLNRPRCYNVSGFGPQKEVIVGNIIKVQCTLRLPVPNDARLILTRDNKDVKDDDSLWLSHTEGTDWEIHNHYWSSYTLRVRKEDSGVTFSCEVRRDSTNNTLVCPNPIKPDIQFPPVANVRSYMCVKKGKQLVMSCDYTPGNPLTTHVKWKTPIGGNPTRNNPLIIDNIDVGKNNPDNYTCVVSNTFFDETVGEDIGITEVEVQYPPIVDTPVAYTVSEGGDIILHCNVQSVPQADEIKWISPDGIIYESNTLELYNASKRNAGLYTCYATNKFCDDIGGYGRGSNSTRVSIKFKPESVILVPHSPVRPDEFLTLTCTTGCGFPSATITWYKNGHAVDDSTGHTILQDIDDVQCKCGGFVSSQQMYILAKPGDNTVQVKCTAYYGVSNEDTIVSDDATIQVEFPPIYPEGCKTSIGIQQKRGDTTGPFPAGTEITLLCKSCSSNPPATIQWYHADGNTVILSPIPVSSRTNNGVFGGTETESNLTMKLSSRDHHSDIYCQAINPDFPTVTALSERFTLNVYYKPFNINGLLNRRVAAEKGESAALNCSVSSNPQPSIRWYGPRNTEIKNNTTRHIFQGHIDDTIYSSSLLVKDIQNEDYGSYSCFAENEYGEVQININLTAQGVPEIALNIWATSTAQSITVNWKPGFDGGSEQTFSIEYGLQREGSLRRSKSTAGNSLEVTGLEGGRRYNLRVISQNQYGENRSKMIVSSTLNSNHSSVIDEDFSVTSGHIEPYHVIIGIVVGMVAVVLLATLIFLIKRRHGLDIVARSKQIKETKDGMVRCVSDVSVTETPHYTEVIPLRDIRNVDESGEMDSSAYDDESGKGYMDLVDMKNSQTYMKPWTFTFEFPRDRLHIVGTISTSRFHTMVRAYAWCIDGKDGQSEVIIKKEKDIVNAKFKGILSKEIDLLKVISTHENITKLIGCCTENGPRYLIFEKASYGDLKTYLQERRVFLRNRSDETQERLIKFAIGIANGMNHLAEHEIVHRYLAAKHILVYEGGICKISNFSYANDVIDVDVFFEMNQGNIPFKWMAVESLTNKEFTSMTDVWSFGVVLWEIFSLGSLPYRKSSLDSLVSLLEKGHRLAKPDHCGEKIFNIMRCCWKWNPQSRPNFAVLHEQLHTLINNIEVYSASVMDAVIVNIKWHK